MPTKHLDLALAALATPTRKPPFRDVPNTAGLYAIHASAATWRQLGLDAPPDARPLYVGKAERSLASHDVHTHFDTGATGQSTVRRTLAALLRTTLSLRAAPRSPLEPTHKPTHYALPPAGDAAWLPASRGESQRELRSGPLRRRGRVVVTSPGG